MNLLPPPESLPPIHTASARWRRSWPWVVLVGLLLVAQSLLLWLTWRYEQARVQEQVDQVATALAADTTQVLTQNFQRIQALLWHDQGLAQWQVDALDLLRQRPELLRLEWRDARFSTHGRVSTPFRAAEWQAVNEEFWQRAAAQACTAAHSLGGPAVSRSYFVPLAQGRGQEVVDLCIPLDNTVPHTPGGALVATMSLSAALDAAATADIRHRHELSLLEADGARLARAGSVRGAGVYKALHVVNWPGLSLSLQVDSAATSPRLVPTLSTALVLGLSLALTATVVLLARDVQRRARAERQLAEALAFRKAMEDSVVTGLRARDLQGRTTYVNPAFCKMVGWSADELIGRDIPPYWPPEQIQAYQQRQSLRQNLHHTDAQASREGYETTFMRRDGEIFPAMVYEAPLVDLQGRHTGWMSASLDLSDQRRAEEVSRQQHEKLQATARLATVGEMASLLSHELNQPLSAIASYATGALNLFGPPTPDAQTLDMIRHANERIAEQAQRAGRVIKSVHDFVRRRVHARESLRVDELVDAVLPLVRMLARKSGARIEVEHHDPRARVRCDRTMIEQVLLNLTRNGLQAMDTEHTPMTHRVLRLCSEPDPKRPQAVVFSVRDQGPGIPEDVAQQLFTPFFTTKAEGMGLGLSLCRTVIEQHGATLDYEITRDDHGHVLGTTFRFTLDASP